jgi:competence protein ComEA
LGLDRIRRDIKPMSRVATSPLTSKENAMFRCLIALAFAVASQLAAAALNLNTASKEELVALSGIGPAKAQAIIDYRVQHGGFKTIEELKDVKGIGARRFEKLKPELTLASPAAKPAARADSKGQAVAARTDAKPIK